LQLEDEILKQKGYLGALGEQESALQKERVTAAKEFSVEDRDRLVFLNKQINSLGFQVSDKTKRLETLRNQKEQQILILQDNFIKN
jgi:hypothetical protein